MGAGFFASAYLLFRASKELVDFAPNALGEFKHPCDQAGPCLEVPTLSPA